MIDNSLPLPDPTLPAAALWLKNIDRDFLHRHGWVQANRQFHGLALAVRPFISRHYDDPAEQEAVFDGFALALIAMGHFNDISQLATLFEASTDTTPAMPEKILPPPVG